jgi:two-component system phosphate regulon response regulator PhoB
MSAPTTVLVVEDDPTIHELVRFTLEEAGFGVVAASSAEQALDRLREVLPDVVLIDWMLPGMTGLALAQRVRAEARTRALPIIMVTARAQEADRVAGLEQGADDYITKPFSPRELVARIRAVLRRRAPEQAGDVLEVGPLRLDPSSHTVSINGTPLDMGPTEFKLLRFLMTQPGRVFTRAQLLDKVWGDHVFIEERTIDVHVRRLRLALGADGESMIETVRGVGYKLARNANAA